jgi:hypothetical protein
MLNVGLVDAGGLRELRPRATKKVIAVDTDPSTALFNKRIDNIANKAESFPIWFLRLIGRGPVSTGI